MKRDRPNPDETPSTSPSEEELLVLEMKLTQVILGSLGPLSGAEIAGISGLCLEDINRWSEPYEDAYEWAVVILTRRVLQRNDTFQASLPTIEDINRAVYTDPGRTCLLNVMGMFQKLLGTAVGHDAEMLAGTLGPELLQQRHVFKMLEGMSEDEAMLKFTKHLAQLYFSVYKEYWTGLLVTMPDDFPITEEKFQAFVTNMNSKPDQPI